ncbi:hypothetical protein SAMN05192541_1644 [Bradyrhizobium arachidis]|nr:hypothetical protein SAMN05192541_1644 [Bradyrhizobium arachidis]
MRSERRPDFPRGVVLPATPEMDAATLQNSFVRSRAVLSRWRVVENFPVATRRGNVWWTSVSEVAQFCDRKQIKVIWV